MKTPGPILLELNLRAMWPLSNMPELDASFSRSVANMNAAVVCVYKNSSHITPGNRSTVVKQ